MIVITGAYAKSCIVSNNELRKRSEETVNIKHHTILTERLSIRPVERRDLAGLFAANSDDAVTRFLPYDSWRDMSDASAWLARTEERIESGEAQQYVIATRANDESIGSCTLFGFNTENGYAEFGYVLARSHWHQGYALEAMRAFTAFAFTNLKLRRLEARVDTLNEPSIKLLRRLGFQQEGVLRKRWTDKGVVADCAVYGLLHEEQLTETNREHPELVVQRQLDAYNARDVDALLRTYASDATQYLHPAQVVASGHAEIRERMIIRFQENNLHAQLLKRFIAENIVIDHEIVTRTFPEGTGTQAMIAIYEVHDGLIQSASVVMGEKKLHD
jgi:[ribosomal protein S5]-alanine N-acetyltransferase